MFLASFAFQWGVGVVLRLWPAYEGRYPAEAYAVAFGILGVLQLAVLLWLLPMRERPAKARHSENAAPSPPAC